MSVTLWLWSTVALLLVLGPLLAMVTTRWLEIGAIVLWSWCWMLAGAAALVALGSML